MDFRAEAVACAGFKNAGRLFDGEEALVAEYVDVVGQLLFGYGRNHLIDQQINVFGLRILTAYGVCTEEGGFDLEWRCLLQTADDAQHLQLVGRIEPVAAFHFYATRTLADDLVSATQGLAIEFVFAQFVEMVGRIEDAAAAAGDLGVTQSADFVDKFGLATTGVNNVGVRVAPRGKNAAAAGIDYLIKAALSRHIVGHFSEAAEAIAVDGEVGIVDYL